MADLASLIVPAASALVGVIASQAWTAWHEKIRWARQTQQRTFEERRLALSRFLVALNRAIDETRHQMAEVSVGSIDVGALPREYHLRWSEAYERQLELALLLPEQARLIVKEHLDRAFGWRKKALTCAAAIGAPVNEHLVELLQDWLNYADLDKKRPATP